MEREVRPSKGMRKHIRLQKAEERRQQEVKPTHIEIKVNTRDVLEQVENRLSRRLALIKDNKMSAEEMVELGFERIGLRSSLPAEKDGYNENQKRKEITNWIVTLENEQKNDLHKGYDILTDIYQDPQTGKEMMKIDYFRAKYLK